MRMGDAVRFLLDRFSLRSGVDDDLLFRRPNLTVLLVYGDPANGSNPKSIRARNAFVASCTCGRMRRTGQSWCFSDGSITMYIFWPEIWSVNQHFECCWSVLLKQAVPLWQKWLLSLPYKHRGKLEFGARIQFWEGMDSAARHWSLWNERLARFKALSIHCFCLIYCRVVAMSVEFISATSKFLTGFKRTSLHDTFHAVKARKRMTHRLFTNLIFV